MAVLVGMNIPAHEDRRTEVELNLLLDGLFQLCELGFRGHNRELMAEKVSQFAAQQCVSFNSSTSNENLER